MTNHRNGSQVALEVKNLPADAGDAGDTGDETWDGTLEKEIGNPFQYSYHLLKSIAIYVWPFMGINLLWLQAIPARKGHTVKFPQKEIWEKYVNLCNKFFFNAS